MKLLRFACLASAIALASPALAQEARDSGSSDANAPVERDGDIIVTANRTESLASKTPVALTAVSGTQLLTHTQAR